MKVCEHCGGDFSKPNYACHFPFKVSLEADSATYPDGELKPSPHPKERLLKTTPVAAAPPAGVPQTPETCGPHEPFDAREAAHALAVIAENPCHGSATFPHTSRCDALTTAAENIRAWPAAIPGPLPVARLEQAEALLRRAVKYATEDRAETPGVTRLARLLGEVTSFLAGQAVPVEVDPVARLRETPCPHEHGSRACITQGIGPGDANYENGGYFCADRIRASRTTTKGTR